jgi:hypothetical protein
VAPVMHFKIASVRCAQKTRLEKPDQNLFFSFSSFEMITKNLKLQFIKDIELKRILMSFLSFSKAT